MLPTRLGPYQILSRLGQGGMGEVFEAEDATTGRRVAVKTLAAHLGGNPALRQRFESEINALKALRHPGIVQLLAFGEEEGRPFFAMELVPGRSLEESLRGGRRYSWRETVALALEITRALKFAHDHGVVHRDLKPANLLLLDEPRDGFSVKLADFGIARLFGDAGQTNAGTVVGTAEYMAPEQARGAPVDQRTDLYAMGLVMFAMLAGRPPFTGPEAARVIERQRSEPAPRISSRAAGIPPQLDDLIDRLLAKDPGQRPASALLAQRILTAVEGLNDDQAPAAGGDPFGVTLDMPAAVAMGTGDERASAAPSTTPTRTAVGATAQRPTRENTQPEAGPGATPAGSTRFTTVAELDARLAAAATRDAAGQRRRQVSGVLAATAVLALAMFMVMRPPSASDLDRRIAAIAADETADLRDARPLIEEFLARYPDDPRADRIARLGRELDLDSLERRARRRPTPGRVLSAFERDYRAALAREAESPAACLAALEAIAAVRAAGADGVQPTESTADESLWLALVRRQIDRLAPLAARERQEDAARAEAMLAQAADLARQAATADDAPRRAALLEQRRGLLAGLVEVFAGRPHTEANVAEARRLLAAEQPAEETAVRDTSSPSPSHSDTKHP
jgi:serine/threonine-protein kinase